MKKWAVIISAVGLAFAVSGCSSDYVMATKDGRMILTDGKPEIEVSRAAGLNNFSSLFPFPQPFL